MKFIYSLILALPLFMITSCDHNDDIPDVDVNITVSGCTVVDNTIYVVKDDGFEVVSVNIENHGTKNAVIGSVVYFWDYARVGDSVIAPYSYMFNTSSTETGKHIFQMEAAIYAVDYAPATAFLSYDVTVVDSADDIPEGAGSLTDTYQLNASIQKDKSAGN